LIARRTHASRRRVALAVTALLASGALLLGACNNDGDTAPTTPGNSSPEVVPSTGSGQQLPEGPSAGPDANDGDAGSPGPETPGDGTP
jgi:hypothetical protein